jgi:hypothetical protein
VRRMFSENEKRIFRMVEMELDGREVQSCGA